MDVCRVLGFHVKSNGGVNVTHAIRHCNDDEIITHRLSNGRTRAAILISESGLYKLVMRSDKPEARKFQDWVTREVLPSIRKDGMYVAAYFGKRHDHVLRDIGTLLPKIGGQSLTTEIDDEPCVLDTDLADRLGMLTPA